MSSSNCCFLTSIQISQEAANVVWYSLPALEEFSSFWWSTQSKAKGKAKGITHKAVFQTFRSWGSGKGWNGRGSLTRRPSFHETVMTALVSCPDQSFGWFGKSKLTWNNLAFLLARVLFCGLYTKNSTISQFWFKHLRKQLLTSRVMGLRAVCEWKWRMKL